MKNIKLTKEQQKLVEDNSKLVGWVINNKRIYVPNGELDDCMQVGYIALCGAASRFNPELGNFASLAIPTIYGEIINYLNRQTSLISRARRKCIKIDGTLEEMANNSTRLSNGTVESNCKKLNISTREYMSLLPTLYINDIDRDYDRDYRTMYDDGYSGEELFADTSLINVDDEVLMEDTNKLIENTINILKDMLRNKDNVRPESNDVIEIFGDWCYHVCIGEPVTYEYLAKKYNRSKQTINKSINNYRRYILKHLDNKKIKSIIEDLRFNADVVSKPFRYAE